MTIAVRLFVFSLLFGGIPGAVPTAAQVCRVEKVANAQAALAEIERLDNANCLGGAACESPICGTVNAVLNAKPPASADAAATLRKLVAEAARLAGESAEGRRLSTQLGLALAHFVDDRETAAAVWMVEDLIIFKDEPYAIDIRTSLTTCASETDCVARLERGRRLLELAQLTRRVLIKAREDSRNHFARRLTALDQQWRAYLSSSRGQYPWELALNSALYRKTAQFDAPPTSQWVFAHPGAAFELTRNAADRQPSEALLLELAGKYNWAWDDGTMKGRWGGSVTLAWRDAGEDRNKLGYGVLAYLPRGCTLGYVWRPQDGRDEHSLVLSADLAKFLRGTDGLKDRLIAGAKSRAGAPEPNP